MSIEQAPKPQESRQGPREKVREDFPQQEKVQESAGESTGEGFGSFQSAQQFVKALKAEEQRQQKKEHSLVDILKNFIATETDEEILEAVLKLLERNVYAGFILGILSLSYHELHQIITADTNLQLNQPMPAEPSSSATKSPKTLLVPEQDLNAAAKHLFNTWLLTLTEIAAAYPQKLLRELNHENKAADEYCQLLIALIANKFFTLHNLPKSVLAIRKLSEEIFLQLMGQMFEQVQEQQALKSK